MSPDTHYPEETEVMIGYIDAQDIWLYMALHEAYTKRLYQASGDTPQNIATTHGGVTHRCAGLRSLYLVPESSEHGSRAGPGSGDRTAIPLLHGEGVGRTGLLPGSVEHNC